jgi:hypothetical protein
MRREGFALTDDYISEADKVGPRTTRSVLSAATIR